MTQATKKRISSSERRELILNTACELFAKHGFDRVSTKQLAAASGCSEALIFQHFPTKAAIYEALFQEWVVIQQTPLILEPIEGSALKTLQELYEKLLDRTWRTSDKMNARPLLSDAIHHRTDQLPRIKEVLSSTKGFETQTLVPLIEYGKKNGEITSTIDSYVLAHLFWTYNYGAQELVRSFPGSYQPLSFSQLKILFKN